MLTLASAVSFGVALAPMAAAQTVVPINVGGTQYDLSLPSEFCLPSTLQQPEVEYLKSLDTMNDTLLHVYECKGVNPNYVVIKMQKNGPTIPLTKTQTINVVAQQMQSEFGQEQIQQGLDMAKDAAKDGTDGQLSLTNAQAGYGGKDEHCAFLNGSNLVTDETGSRRVMYGSCLTPVGQKLIAIHSYALVGEGISFDMLEARSSEFAANISAR